MGLKLSSALALVLSAQALAGRAEPTSTPDLAEERAPVVTHHTGVFNGATVRYAATVETTPVRDAKGAPGAEMVSFAYTAEATPDPARRPVVFLFNGGPISPSDILHIAAFGPKRFAVPDDLKADPASGALVDNPYTVLDVADLVFIDPASTGFSRTAAGKSASDYFSVEADGQQVSAFIAEWLKRHGRMSSPKYIVGESYGTLRAAEVADQLAKAPEPIELDGVVLLGQALNIIEFSQRPGNVISYVVSLPTLAAIAWDHGKADRGGRSFEQFLDDARRFARTDYLQALIQGDQLDPAVAAKVAARLQGLTGMPAAYYLAHDLEITKERFRTELLKDQGLVLGVYDARYVGPPTKDGPGDPSMAVEKALEGAFQRYLRTDLKVDWPETYVVDSPVKGLGDWRWGGTSPFSDWPYMDLIGDAMRRDPKLRVLMGVGYYDTSTTTGATEYALVKSGWPKARRGVAYYQGGHMSYTNAAAQKKLGADMHAFLSGAMPGRPGGPVD